MTATKYKKFSKGKILGTKHFFFSKFFSKKFPSNDEKIVLNKFGGNNLYSAQNPKLPRGHHSSFPGILKEFFVKKVPQSDRRRENFIKLTICDFPPLLRAT